MATFDHDRFFRLLTRCAELAAEPEMKTSIVRVYNDLLKQVSDRFLEAHTAVHHAEAAAHKQTHDALAALAALDAPYRETRSVVLAFVPEAKLPDTLKMQPTDTDKLNAIEALREALFEHAGEAWADEQASEAFGLQAPAVLAEMTAAIAAGKALSEARQERASAYAPAYEQYLRFKRVVRDGLGPKSKQYQRIHVRAATASPPDAPPPPAAATSPTPQAPLPA